MNEEEQIEDLQNDEELVYMCIIIERGQLGVAVYDALTSRFKMLNVQVGKQSELERTIEILRSQFDPHRILLSSRNCMVHPLMEIMQKVDDRMGTSASISIRKHSDFSYLKAFRSIEHVRFGGQTIASHDNGSESQARTCFGTDNIEVIRAAGALLHYILTEKIGAQLEDTLQIYLVAFEHVALDGYMCIDMPTMKALQIFSVESHPSLVKAHGRAKEGFSLYGVLDKTSTKCGSYLLRQWMLNPLVKRDCIESRHASVEFFKSNTQDCLRSGLKAQLRHFGDVNRILQRIKNMTSSPLDWCKLNDSIGAFTVIKYDLESISVENGLKMPEVVYQIVNHQDIEHVANLLSNVIDFDESRNENRVIIRAGVSDILDKARTRYESIDNILEEVACQIQQENPLLSTITLHYIPQVGYVIKSVSRSVPPSFEFQFQEDCTFYFKDEHCRDLDESVGDIFALILDLQKELLSQLVLALCEHESSIQEMTDLIANLDCLLSFAECARAYNYYRPQLETGEVMYVKSGRHPLQEMIVDSYIPNDVLFKPQTSSMIQIVTGQNGSGKSVYLKMIGLIQYMTQIGSFVPAEIVRISLVSSIFSRIQRLVMDKTIHILFLLYDDGSSFETAAGAHSSFTVDCNQVAKMFLPSSKSSLLLIDEFGKGTTDNDGAALLASTLKHVVKCNREGKQLRAIVSTHFLDMMEYELLLGEDDHLTFLSMRCQVRNELGEEEAESIPLYEIEAGQATASHALQCAASSGVRPSVVKRAKTILNVRHGITTALALVTDGGERFASNKRLVEYFLLEDQWSGVKADQLQNLSVCATIRT